MILSEKDLQLLSSMPVSVPEERRENDLKIEFDGTTVLCRVCGDKASGFHYGVHSCEGCKGFFRRSIQQKIQYRPCTKNQQCSILRINRNRCQYCRLKKCIAVGMSRDAVRFGRVPKREKAKILAAMQKVNACSQEKALGAELEDELRLLTMIVRAHDETCEFTKDKVTTLIEKASREVTSHYPMACPLNPAPHLLENGRMETFSQRFAPAIQGVVEFAKRCPAFGFLSQEDQVTLLRASVFEVLLVRLACMFDSQAKTLVSLNGQILRRENISNANNGRFLMDSMFEFAERLNAIGLSDSEVGLFCAVVVITTDRPGLRNIDLVSRIQSKLTNILRKAVTANHPENPNAFEQLMNTIPDLRTLNALHSEKLQLKEVAPQNGKSAGAMGQVSGAIGHVTSSIGQATGQITGTMSQVAGAIETMTATSMAPPITYTAIPHDLWSQYALIAPHPPCLNPEEDLMRNSTSPIHHNGNSNGSEWTNDFTKNDRDQVSSPTSTGGNNSPPRTYDVKSPVRTYSEDAKSPPSRTYIDDVKSPVRTYMDEVVKSPTRNYMDEVVKSPPRSYLDDIKSPSRNYMDDAKSPPRSYIEDVKSPVRTYVEDVKSPVRAYMEDVKSPVRTYIEDVKSPVQNLSFPSPPRYTHEETWPSDLTQTVVEYSQNIPKKPGSDHGSSSGEDEGCFVDSPIKATMYPKLLRVDSPTDSGIDSGKEHGASTSPTLSLCSSPHSSSSLEEKLKDVMEHNNAPEKHESIEDMPVLKRALQAPPIINPNMLMDEAYRHHKKFRAARREAEGPASPSQMSLASTHSTLVKTLEQAPRYLSEQQLKRTDLIHNIIMQKETLPGQPENNHYSFSNARSSPNTTYANGQKNLLICQNGYYNGNSQYSSWPFAQQQQQSSPVQQQYEHISSHRAGSPRILYNPRSPQTCTSPLVMNGICQSDARLLHHSEAMHKESQPLNLSKKLFTAPMLKMES